MRLPICLFSLLLTLLFIISCSTSPPSQHFFIAPLADPDGTTGQSEPAAEMTTIEVQVRIPRYLDRPQIVTRTGPNEYRLDEFNRWTGSLKGNITTVVIQNLKALIPNAFVAQRPIPSVIPVDYVVFVDVVQFDGVIGQSVTLLANWGVLEKGDKIGETLQPRSFNATESVDAKGYASLVAAKSRILLDLSQEIIQALDVMKAEKHTKADG